MAVYRTIDGDVVDAICKAHYGTEAMSGAVYEANPGLARLGPVLPKGLEITLPDQPAEQVHNLQRLW